MNSFFRKLRWLNNGLTRKPNCARNFSSTWTRKRNSARRRTGRG